MGDAKEKPITHCPSLPLLSSKEIKLKVDRFHLEVTFLTLDRYFTTVLSLSLSLFKKAFTTQ